MFFGIFRTKKTLPASADGRSVRAESPNVTVNVSPPVPSAKAAIEKPNRVASAVGWILIIGAVLFLLVRFAGPETAGETIRRKLEQDLQRHYRGLLVSIGSGSLDPNMGGILLEDLQIWSRDDRGRRGHPLLKVDKMVAKGRIDKDRLLARKVPFLTERLEMHGVQVDVWANGSVDGRPSFSIEQLFPTPQLGPVCPETVVHDALIRWHTDTSSPTDIYAKQIRMDAHQDGASVHRKISMVARSSLFKQTVMELTCDARGIEVRGRCEQLHFERRWIDKLPEPFRSAARDVAGFEGTGDATWTFYRPIDPTIENQFRIDGELYEASFAHPHLPRRLEQIRARFHGDNQKFTLVTAQAMFNQSRLQASGSLEQPLQAIRTKTLTNGVLNLTARGLVLDGSSVATLPPKLQSKATRLQPRGVLDADVRLVAKPGPIVELIDSVDIQGNVYCKGIDISYEKFPYPVTEIVGSIEIENGRMSTESLVGRIAGNRMGCQFDLPMRPEIDPVKYLEVAVEGAVAIDNNLLKSLSPRGQRPTKLETFVRQLHPRGLVRLRRAVFRTDEEGRQNKSLDLQIVDGHLRYDQFPYPLYNVVGTITVDDTVTRLVNFRGSDAGAAEIRCDGVVHTPRQGGQTMALQFDCHHVSMDRTLRDSLPEDSTLVWDSLAPAGILDHLAVRLDRAGNGPLVMNLSANQDRRDEVAVNNLSIRPRSFPYRLDITGGAAHYDGQQVRLDKISATHNQSRLAGSGACRPDQTGRWVLDFDVARGSRLYPSADLIAALPDSMRMAMRQLQLRGPLNVRGGSRLEIPRTSDEPTVVDWDVILQMEGNRIGDTGPVHSIRGELGVRGHRDANDVTAEGQVQIDSMHVWDHQITGIVGPFQIVNDELRMGKASQQPDSIRGKIFGGQIALDGTSLLSRGSFDVGIDVNNAELPEILAELGYGDQELTGVVTGHVDLAGLLGTLEPLRGSGTAKLRGANVYELPLLVQVFNQLRIAPSPKNAFTDGVLQFGLFADHVTIENLQLWGDLVSIQGGGELDRRQNLNLTFNTRVSPQNAFSKLIRPLRDSRYTLMTIDVTGPLEDLTVRRRALEGVNQTLDILFPRRPRADDTTSYPALSNPSVRTALGDR